MAENAKNGELGWENRRMGKEKPILPEGSRVRHIQLDTNTHVEYGEKTWTTGQTVRDIFQNHLDAHTQEFFEELVSKVVDTQRLQELSEKDLQNFDAFTYQLYLYRMGLGDRTPEADEEMIHKLNSYILRLPIRPEFLFPNKGLDYVRLQETLREIHERPLKLMFKVTDQTATNDADRWVTQEELASSPHYKITGIEIQDFGSGFDNMLTAFYKSTKRDKKHLRGKFGEGDKMSRTHLIRHGATMRSRSRYLINHGRNTERLWQHRPYLDPEDKRVKLKGIEVEMPNTGENRFGSSTRIDTAHADPAFSIDFSNQVDPRIKDGGLASNCLEYSSAKFYYPMAISDIFTKPMGVSLEASPILQFVQGLRVGDDQDAQENKNKKLFSYNILDSSILKGRDRNKLHDLATYQVMNFWKYAESSELLTSLIRRVYIDPPPEGRYEGAYVYYAEDTVIENILGGNNTPVESQANRVRAMYLDIFTKSLGIEAGKKYVFVTPEDTARRGTKLFPLLEKSGYTIVPIQCKIDQSTLSLIAKQYQNTFELQNFETVKGDMETWDLSESLNHEQVEKMKPVFAGAFLEFNRYLRSVGLSSDSVEDQPSFAACVDPTKEQPIEAEFISEHKKFRIKIRPEAIFTEKSGVFDATYWQDRIIVELMVTAGRKEEFKNRVSAMQHAQDVAQHMLEKSAAGNPEELSLLLDSFHYEEGDERKYQDAFFEKLKDARESLRAWEAVEKSRTLNLSLADFENLATQAPTLPDNYRNTLNDILARQIIIENGMVGFCNWEMEGKNMILKFHKTPLASLAVCGEIDGTTVYRLGYNRLIMPNILPNGTVIEEGRKKNVVFNNQIFAFADHSFGLYHPAFLSASVHSQCVSIEFRNWSGKIPLSEAEKKGVLLEVREKINELKFILPENDNLKAMKILQGTVRTPLPIEYGKDEWSNPVRVFQDIVQNHVDASPDRRVELRFEIARDNQRLWMKKEGVRGGDTIVGFAVMDNGNGYAPDDLGTMGKSSKKSPLFAGKYGEGQKMVAAAASRQNFDLKFSSIAAHDGKRYRWTGTVDSEAQEIITNGNPQNERRVVFNIESEEATQDDYASMTTLRLPDDPSRYQDPEWLKWVEIIDPRIQDGKGNEGLSRYILNLRENRKDGVIDMGYMKVLLNEPGAVYENGLLVSQRKDLAFGYDVPELVTTRERNAYDPTKLRSYIAHAYTYCHDPQLANAVLKTLREKYFVRGAKYFLGSDIKEQDLAFGNLPLSVPESKPYWDLASSEQLPGHMVTSRSYLRNRIAHIINDFKVANAHADADGLARLQMTLANLDHIPEDQLIDVGASHYMGWSKLLPDAENYTMSLASQEVPVDEEILRRLRNMIAERARNLSNMLTALAADPEYIKLMIQSPDESNEYIIRATIGVLTELSQFWSSAESLSEKPESVFVAPAHAGYLGSIKKDRLGINEILFTPENINKLVGIADHELIHKLTGLGDYKPEFIIFLLKLAQHNLRVATL